MRDEIDTAETQTPPAEEKKKPAELADQDLDSVSGGTGAAQPSGRASPGDFHFTHLYDKASPVLKQTG